MGLVENIANIHYYLTVPKKENLRSVKPVCSRLLLFHESHHLEEDYAENEEFYGMTYYYNDVVDAELIIFKKMLLLACIISKK